MDFGMPFQLMWKRKGFPTLRHRTEMRFSRIICMYTLLMSL